MVKKEKNIQYYEAVGRRKRAVARVRLHLVNKEKIASVGALKIKSGETYINGKHIDKFLTLAYERQFINNPLRLTSNEGRFAISINVSGGGRNGQLEAMMLASGVLAVVDGNEEILADEEINLHRHYFAGIPVVYRKLEDHERVFRVGHQAGALERRQAGLEIQRVEIKFFPQRFELVFAKARDVNPPEPFGVYFLECRHTML